MFATTLGPLPLPTGIAPAAALGERLAASVALQVEAGLGLLADGGLHGPGTDPVEAWRATAAYAGAQPVKAVLAGFGSGLEGSDRLATAIRALDAAGCPFVEVSEPIVPTQADDCAALVERHRRLTAGLGPLGTHLGLALGAGAERLGTGLFATSYRSFGFDLIAGPDDWRVAVLVPGDRGLVLGAIDPRSPGPGDLEAAIWALRYAASTQGRGPERVGLAVAPGLDRLDRPDAGEVARRKLRTAGEAARLGTASRTELAELVDPRALGPF